MSAIELPDNQRIYDRARKWLGVAEYPGPKSNPEIAKFFDLAPDWLDQDDSTTAWCGLFRGYVGHVTMTGLPREHYRARRWMEWGEAVTLAQAVRGDTVITQRSGGHHVALFDRMEGHVVYLLGGNQGNKVSIAAFSSGVIIGVRRYVPGKA